MEPYRLVLADDHGLFREGLRRILEESPDLKVVGEASDGRELLDLLKGLTPDLILLDISMPNVRGIDAIPEIKKIRPSAKILILTTFSEKAFVYESIAMGANGYFLKRDAGPDLYSAIEDIRRGKIYVPRYFSEQLGLDWEDVRRAVQKPALTTREKEILSLVAEGKSNKEIAELLFISVFTVKRHRTNIMDKLNLKSTSELVKYAIQKGYI
ncbi:MAG: hypothetical protein A2156_16245 [Deltaproteobacteria bacterium RBG_16_48_10]|nr:MAG: hypothetical protein A2156_16245 [Deltaproteobacteria bacterium RBG_16_48_10]